MSIRDEILAADDLVREPLEVPEWGLTVHVRTMTAGGRDQFELEQLKDPETDVRARLAIHTLCDAEGNLLFTTADLKSLSAKSSRALQRVFDVALHLNRITKEDIDELEKNSEAGP